VFCSCAVFLHFFFCFLEKHAVSPCKKAANQKSSKADSLNIWK
jgi:hypothetical protein